MHYGFFAYLARMRYIFRWNLMRSTTQENIAEHSQQVAVIAHALAIIKNRLYGGQLNADRIAAKAQYHEASEVITGDLPAPIKYQNQKISEAYKELERLADDSLLKSLPPELVADFQPYIQIGTDDYDYRIIKAADKLAALAKCLEEIKSGNAEFKKARASIEKELDAKYNMDEVVYFRKTFMKSFEMSLDELG